MLKDGLDEITQDLSNSFEEAQNTLQLKSQIQLLKYIKDDNWMQKQLASKEKFKLNILTIARREVHTINQKYEKAFKDGLKNVNGGKPSEESIKRLFEVKNQNARMMSLLANKMMNAHEQYIMRIGLQQGQTVQVSPLEKADALYNQICEVTSRRDIQDEVKVAYGSGKNIKKFSFKSYMEMNARTTLNQEIGKQQMENAEAMGVVFWLCNNFDNARTTHQDVQGKVYFDERWESYDYDDETKKKIQDAIDSREMVSRQSVENFEPFLGNCPNCRHEFIAVPISDVITMSDKELLKSNNMSVSQASEEKYQSTQQQRLYERKIRDYKMRIENDKLLKESAPNGVAPKDVESKLAHDMEMLKTYQGRVRDLVKEKPYLERDYTRENPHILREDLGVASKEKLYYGKTEQFKEERTSKSFISSGKLTITKNKNNLYEYKFKDLESANKYLESLGYKMKKVRINFKDIDEINKYASAIKNIKENFNNVKYSDFILNYVKPTNKNVILENPIFEFNKHGSYVHMASGHKEDFINKERIDNFVDLIKNATKENFVKEELTSDFSTRYTFVQKAHDQTYYQMFLDFKNGNLVYFSSYYGKLNKDMRELIKKKKTD